MDPYSPPSHYRNSPAPEYLEYNALRSNEPCHSKTGTLVETLELSPVAPSSQQPSSTRRPKGRKRRTGRRERWFQWANDRWLFEFGALFISAATLGATIVILMQQTDRPLPQWPYGITINTLVSTLATISRSALLTSLAAAISQRKWIRLSRGIYPLSDIEVYDEASRGPWGSLSLLWSVRLSDIASLGAVTTILSLTIGPFLQQITKFESVPLTVGKSSIASRVIFEMGASPKGNATRDAFAQIPTAFIPLVNQGLYFDGDLNDPFSRNTLQLRPLSTGGNVTFPVVETLAVCSRCANITHLLPPPDNCMPGYGECCGGGDCDEHWWKWLLPNGVTTEYSHYGDRSTMVLRAQANAELLEIDMTGRLTILNLTVIAPTWIYIDGDYENGAGRAGAAQECTLYWCVNKYKSALNGGVLSETLVSSYSTGAPEPNDVPFFSMKPPGSESSVARPDNSELYGDYPSGWVNGSFLVNMESHRLLRGFLQAGILDGYLVSLNFYNPGAGIPDFPTMMRLYSKAWWEGPENTTRIDIQDIFEAIAQGMTTVVRSTDRNQPGMDALVGIEGPETTMQVIVRVRWVWIILPVALLLAGSYFVCETFIMNSRWKLESWKSSPLALLFVGMRMADKVEHRDANKVVDMTSIARNYWPNFPSKSGL